VQGNEYEFYFKFLCLFSGEKNEDRLRFDEVTTVSLVAPFFLEHRVVECSKQAVQLSRHNDFAYWSRSKLVSKYVSVPRQTNMRIEINEQ